MHSSSRPYFGWYVVLTCFVMAVFAWGFGFYGHAVFLAELRKQHGWSTSVISGATTAYYLFGAVLSAWFGEALERLGPRLLVSLGVLAMSASSAWVPFVTAPWELYVAYLVMAFGWASLSLVAITTILARWFVRRRGLAISLALNGASTGGIVIGPLLIWLIERHGFGPAMLGTVAAMLVLSLPLVVFAMHRDPQAIGLQPDGDGPAPAGPAPASAGEWTRARAMRSWNFWIVATPFALGISAQVGFIMHQVAFLGPVLGPDGVALAVFMASIAAVVGRVGLGFFIDRLDQRLCAAISFSTQALSLLAMMASSEPLALYGACILFGLSVGNVITYTSLIVQREFTATAFPMIVGFSTAMNQIAYALAPGLLGAIRDLAGGYWAVLLACVVMQLAATVVVLQRPRREAAPAQG
jgi:MFS family permease